MTDPIHIDQQRLGLRQRASARLSPGTEANHIRGGAQDALAVLHQLASSPDTAGDALALLHELQVYQVELDLQAEELRASRGELESSLRRQIELYDHLPVGCLTLDRAFVVQELNLTGARMLGIERDEAFGWPFENFVVPKSALALRQLVSRLACGDKSATATLQLAAKVGAGTLVQGHVGADPRGDGVFVVLAAAGSSLAT
ncbi:MAG: PAS domain-containing protein [Betaproteobacteria bacterium]